MVVSVGLDCKSDFMSTINAELTAFTTVLEASGSSCMAKSEEVTEPYRAGITEGLGFTYVLHPLMMYVGCPLIAETEVLGSEV